MAIPEVAVRQLLEAGVHFGHKSHRWNPKMAPYIFGVRNGVHVIDLTQTVPLLYQALNAVSATVARGGRVLFVGTKRQAATPIAEAAKACAQYYINKRWLGGILTNWKTVSVSIKHLQELEDKLKEDSTEGLTKKEILKTTRAYEKLQKEIGGIREIGGVPDLVFVIDTNREKIAMQEARKLKIPIVAIVDSNSNPDGIDYPIPGNDDSARSIKLYCDLVSQAAVDGIEKNTTAISTAKVASDRAPDNKTPEENISKEDSDKQKPAPKKKEPASKATAKVEVASKATGKTTGKAPGKATAKAEETASSEPPKQTAPKTPPAPKTPEATKPAQPESSQGDVATTR